MAQISIIPLVRSSARHLDGSAAIEARWPLRKTAVFVVWASAALWAVIILLARAFILTTG